MARLDRDPPEPTSRYANTSQTDPGDRAILESATGRVAPDDDDQSEIESVREDEIREKSGGGEPASDRTNFRTSGSGAIETEDGLDEIEESVRHAAEDVGDKDPTDRDGPVFDMAEQI
ncbi:hypothetical protein ACIKT0_01540 [Hansschlegelia beijingensis]|uniref:hypothetical protein n=1 Tax=Hansschlegelia beijingensis TaxID=1133344 RepID=UPI00387EED5C